VIESSNLFDFLGQFKTVDDKNDKRITKKKEKTFKFELLS